MRPSMCREGAQEDDHNNSTKKYDRSHCCRVSVASKPEDLAGRVGSRGVNYEGLRLER